REGWVTAMHRVSVTPTGSIETNTGRRCRRGAVRARRRVTDDGKIAFGSGKWTLQTKAGRPGFFVPPELYVVRLLRTEHHPPRERTRSATWRASRSLAEQNCALPRRSTHPSVSMRPRKRSRRAS